MPRPEEVSEETIQRLLDEYADFAPCSQVYAPVSELTVGDVIDFNDRWVLILGGPKVAFGGKRAFYSIHRFDCLPEDPWACTIDDLKNALKDPGLILLETNRWVWKRNDIWPEVDKVHSESYTELEPWQRPR